ncbi:murein L,D-transpeptidase [Shewanella sp. NIFS-20-20]|uniref:L,D-transpeptidase family protein n=1 Tax=Shewanella sp. NIFS-20-20 TaxID=2853806 RepID=UPI001C43D8A9|nr:L,D-transpeptidase family protein [Shewanella sp. NIFS-20-20]MBV7315094.1 L,D-transpeptidase family protein [Shewanella sp. NIFS-20-20]
MLVVIGRTNQNKRWRSLWLIVLLLASWLPQAHSTEPEQIITADTGQIAPVDLLRTILLNHVTLLALANDPNEWRSELSTLSSNIDQRVLDAAPALLQRFVQFWQQGEPLPSSASLLAQAIALEPRVEDYLWVINRIRHLLWLDAQGDWANIEFQGLIEPDDLHQSIPLIAKRLTLLGDSNSGDVTSLHYRPELVDDIRRFQRRHGLKDDGIIGPNTLMWLNKTPYRRARLLASNFVLKTRYQQQLQATYLLINIPAFELVLIEDGKPRLQSRVIVGRSSRQTPELSSQVSNIVLNPTWRVPRGILRKDLLPKIRKDGSYLKRHHFDVFDVDGSQLIFDEQAWQTLANGRFPYLLVQRAGEGNALGKYKLYFNNGFNVYLHDTPDKHLFDESMRALSSGCIRVEKIDELAQWMANQFVIDKKQWNRMSRTSAQETQWFSFNQTVPVHLVYWTAWMDGPSLSQFRGDIYHKQNDDVEQIVGRLKFNLNR